MMSLKETWADDYGSGQPEPGFYARNLGVSGQRGGSRVPDWSQTLDLRTISYDVLLRELRPAFSAVLQKLTELAQTETGHPLEDETVALAMEIFLKQYLGINTAQKVLAHLNQVMGGGAQ